MYLACTCWDADFMQEVVGRLSRILALEWVVSTEDLETVRAALGLLMIFFGSCTPPIGT